MQKGKILLLVSALRTLQGPFLKPQGKIYKQSWEPGQQSMTHPHQ